MGECESPRRDKETLIAEQHYYDLFPVLAARVTNDRVQLN
jgi:hypothetical protein